MKKLYYNNFMFNKVKIRKYSFSYISNREKLNFNKVLIKGNLNKNKTILKTSTKNYNGFLSNIIDGKRCYSTEVIPLNDGNQKPTDVIESEASKIKRDAEEEDKLEAEKGENLSGHIAKDFDQGIVYFDNVVPAIRYSKFSEIFFKIFSFTDVKLRSYIAERAHVGVNNFDNFLRKNVKEMNKNGSENKTENSANSIVTITKVTPRYSEGGAFVKFNVKLGESIDVAAKAIANRIDQAKLRPWYNPFSIVACYRVYGVPWIEDLRRNPSSKLLIKFRGEGTALDEEGIYILFRRYGFIKDITPPTKDEPNKAYIVFERVRSASIAKNCLHGMETKSGQSLYILYVPNQRVNLIKDLILNHPRISIPLIIAIVTAIAVSIFSPIRKFFIEQKITQKYKTALVDNTYVRFIRNYVVKLYSTIRKSKLLSFTHLGDDYTSDKLSWINSWKDRLAIGEELTRWLDDNSDSFVVVRGPPGSDKESLLKDIVLYNKHNVLWLDCLSLVDARNDSHFLSNIAYQTGYFPTFPWVNNLATFFDLAITGLTGQKSGIAESVEAQYRGILNTTATVLRSIALSQYDNKQGQSETEYLESHPEALPVVVLQDYLRKSDKMNSQNIYGPLTEFAAYLVATSSAHVIILTSDAAYHKVLSEALPEQAIKVVALRDADSVTSRNFVIENIKHGKDGNTDSKDPIDVKELDGCVGKLGGRMTDLQKLVRRINNGESPTEAVGELINSSIAEILKLYLYSPASGYSVSTDLKSGNRGWGIEQSWAIVKLLARSDVLSYGSVISHPLFKGVEGELALAQLEHASMISINTKDGEPYNITAGKPVYRSAFIAMVSQPQIAAKMEIVAQTAVISSETKKISAWGDELRTLGKSPSSSSRDISSRISYLGKKIQASQSLIDACEKSISEARNTLSKT